MESLGCAIPTILLPAKNATFARKWPVVACDQYTAQLDYWQNLAAQVGDEPSTLNLIYPEVYLNESVEAKDARIAKINATMKKYLDEKIFEEHHCLVYVERHLKNGATRHGLMIALDLEKYDYSKGSTSLIRATEGTVESRIPPRVEIRQGAAIELPHILVLIDDPKKTAIEEIGKLTSTMEVIYDTDLMMDSGRLVGYKVPEEAATKFFAALESLKDINNFRAKYDVNTEHPLLFAMGDGNHSLATAKFLWERMKKEGNVTMDHPARYALVELTNLHDESLEFEAIHRVLFDTKKDILADLAKTFGENFTYTKVATAQEMVSQTKAQKAQGHTVGFVRKGEYGLCVFSKPSKQLPVGTLQDYLDNFMKEHGAHELDYIHGEDVLCEKAELEGNCGFYLPSMGKDELFKTVICDGVTPRKTFSMGEARDKRFYMECRRIQL